MLYVGGSFSTAGGISANNIARWDGSTWSALGSGIIGQLNTLVGFDVGSGSALYISGDFNTAGGGPANSIARFEGGTFSSVSSSSGIDGPIVAFEVLDAGVGKSLYATGSFVRTGGLISNEVACWNGNYWRGLGGGANAPVADVEVYNDGTGPALYACGEFTEIGGVAANYIAKWTGSVWQPLGSRTNIPINAMAVFDEDAAGPGVPALFAACDFFQAGEVSVNRIGRWDGVEWTPLGAFGAGLATGVVNALAVYDDGSGEALYVGGAFSHVNDVPIDSLAKWDGTSWSDVGAAGGVGRTSGIGHVASLEVVDLGLGPSLFVRGTFNTVDGFSAINMAIWNGVWDQLAGGFAFSSHDALDFAVWDDGGGADLYITGDFGTRFGSNQIARWDGVSWSSLGIFGLNNIGRALGVFDDGSGPALFVAGDFTEAGGLAARGVAKWDGFEWSVLDLGLWNENPSAVKVNDLAVFDGGSGSKLYAGGSFERSGNSWPTTSLNGLGALPAPRYAASATPREMVL